jgi:hypothetical protein
MATVAAVVPIPAAPETGYAVPFSLFEGDGLNRLYTRLGMGRDARFALLKRCLFAVILTYVPIALLALIDGSYGGGATATNFFADFAAYIQLLVSLPLFIVTERVMDWRTRDVAAQLLNCRIVRDDDIPLLDRANSQLAQLRTPIWSDLACLAVAYLLSAVVLVPEFTGTHLQDTWHVHQLGGRHLLTWAGAWAFLIALPVLNYIWVRFIWKICLWVFFLWHVKRLPLDLHPTHPDQIGGIGFISEAQGHFALFILAYGLSNIAAPVGYEIVILHYHSEVLTVWGPILCFAIGAPLLFTAPLFMFTSQLYWAKQHAIEAYRARVTEHSRRIEGYWQANDRGVRFDDAEVRELNELNTLNTMFSHIGKMRVVPLDFRSFMQLIGSSFGTIATLLTILQFDKHATDTLDLIGKLLDHFH